MSERGGHPVVRIPLRQWMLRITAYADRLEKDLDGLDWSESIKLLQRNWIGRSTGRRGRFLHRPLERTPTAGRRRTNSRPGVRPHRARLPAKARRRRAADLHHPARHALRRHLHGHRPGASAGRAADAAGAGRGGAGVLRAGARKSDLDRTDLAKDKTGVFTGSYAVNPVNGKAIPIWVADYVLISYGTGAIMAVPAHDTRDFEFAKQFDLPIVPWSIRATRRALARRGAGRPRRH